MTINTRIALAASAAVVSLSLALAPAAFAQDKMGKDDGMKKDSMSKDSMKKDDAMSKDSMKKEAAKLLRARPCWGGLYYPAARRLKRFFIFASCGRHSGRLGPPCAQP